MSAELADIMSGRTSAPTANDARVAVIITTYNHARFLAQAIDSALAQTHPPHEIIVVDDGSDDHPGRVVDRYPTVRYIAQPNRGLAAARNTGLRATACEAVVFLDADDRLLPNALAAGLDCLRTEPGSGFVYGAHRRITIDGAPLGADRYDAIGADAYTSLLCGNLIGMHATVMYRRERLITAGGFDATLARCEDYEVYFRMAQLYPVMSYPEVIAEYRWHGDNASAAHREMLKWVLRVHRRQWSFALVTPDRRRAWRRGRQIWRDYYAEQILADARQHWRQNRDLAKAAAHVASAVVVSPRRAIREGTNFARRHLKRDLAKGGQPELGAVRFGDLDRLKPVDDNFGYGRGTPLDRYYIENFLAHHTSDIAGRVLEIGDDAYTRRFGGSRVTRADVLHVRGDIPGVTIVGDLAAPETLPADTFDCLVITQTLHLVYDTRVAVTTMHRALKPGGVLLLTVPGISQIDRGEWKPHWHWSFTTASARRLFGDVFGDEIVAVETKGNVFAATAFLHGLALEEIDRRKLDFMDEAYPVIVAVRAQKRSTTGEHGS